MGSQPEGQSPKPLNLNLTGLQQLIDDLLKFHGIVGKNPLDTTVQLSKQAIFGIHITGSQILHEGFVSFEARPGHQHIMAGNPAVILPYGQLAEPEKIKMGNR